jgi:hypothetical protein
VWCLALFGNIALTVFIETPPASYSSNGYLTISRTSESVRNNRIPLERRRSCAEYNGTVGEGAYLVQVETLGTSVIDGSWRRLIKGAYLYHHWQAQVQLGAGMRRCAYPMASALRSTSVFNKRGVRCEEVPTLHLAL